MAFSFVNENGRPKLDDFRKIVRFARQKKIDLRLFISPVHTRMLEFEKFIGLWPYYESRKRNLVAILAVDAATHPGSRPFHLWDFSGYNEVTTEPFPEPERKVVRMNFFWELFHYRKEVGDMILDRIFIGKKGPVLDFGVLLDSRIIESHISTIRKNGIGYGKPHAAELARLRREWDGLVSRQAVLTAETGHPYQKNTTNKAQP